MTGQMDRIRPAADHDRAPESGPASSAGGPGRRNDSSAEGNRLLIVACVLLISLGVCFILAALFERIGWRQAAYVANGLGYLLAFFVSAPLTVYIVVKVVRGEIQW
jgi:hypothetical protein